MRCNWCNRDAVYAAESDGIRVGVCETHLSERVAALGENAVLIDLCEKLES